MLSSVPSVAQWPFSKLVDRVEKVVEVVGNWGSFLSFAPGFNASDNMLAIPGSPMDVLDSELKKLPLAAYDGVTYPAPYTMGGSFISLASVVGKAWLSQDKGKSWTLQSSGTYGVGAIFRFKDRMLSSSSAMGFQSRVPAQNLNGSATAMSVTPAVNGGPEILNFGAKNANCIVTSGNHTSTATTMFVSWTFPTFNSFNTGSDQAVKYYYLGNNIFYTQKGSTVRFYYVPATPGPPGLLLTKTTSIAVRINHVRNKVFFTKLTGEIRMASLAAVAEDPAISSANAAAYLQKVFAAIEGAATEQVLPAGPTSYSFQWGFNRFVAMTRQVSPALSKYHIWEVKTAKPSNVFTIRAAYEGFTGTSSTGFGLAVPSYGFGKDYGELLIPPSNPELTVYNCGDFRQNPLSGYGGFGLHVSMAKATLLAKYAAVKANGRTFSFDSLELTECRAFGDGARIGTLCNWMLDLAEFVAGETYVIELIPR